MFGGVELKKDQEISKKAFSIEGMFYSLALLVWSGYDLVTKKTVGVPFVLMSLGGVLFLSVFMFYRKKDNKNE